MNRQDLYHQQMADYERSFADHQLLKIDELEPHRAMLRIGRPGTCIFLTEIAISLGHIVLWGDISTVAFMGGDGGPWQSQLEWLGGGRDDFRYCASKASRGSGHKTAWDTDERVARADLLEARRNGYIDAEQARDAFDALTGGHSVDMVKNDLYQAGVDSELVCDLGEIVSPSVLCAVAALRKAHQLVCEGARVAA